VQSVPISRIRIPEFRVRTLANERVSKLLKESYKQIGWVHRPIVRKKGKYYELVAGEKRIEVAKSLGKKQIEVEVIQADDKLAKVVELVENIARGKVDYLSVLDAVYDLTEKHKLKLEQVSLLTGIKKETLERVAKLKQADDFILEAIRDGEISFSHALELMRLPSEDLRRYYLDQITRYGVSVEKLRIEIQRFFYQLEMAKKYEPLKTTQELVETLEPPRPKLHYPASCRDCIRILEKLDELVKLKLDKKLCDMEFKRVINLAEHLWKYAENFFPEKKQESAEAKLSELEGE